MTNNAAIENFIKKYRIALKSQSKDIRITVEEAGDIVASIALINSGTESIDRLEKTINLLKQEIQNNSQTVTQPNMDGGQFKP